MRIMGLDVGDKTIGVALSDPTGLLAQGLKTIWRQSNKKDFLEISQLVETYQVEKIVVGLPKNMNNSMGPQGEKALHFGEKLKRKLDIDVVFEDERLTTISAERALIQAGIRRENRKSVVDKIAASFILQSYLDRVKKEG
ncbi:MAG: Holliday junction resolvase RuvX [Tissierellia bacterium]|nr:Holliday junction resolvase RuvX [Tissierellia bacterium]